MVCETCAAVHAICPRLPTSLDRIGPERANGASHALRIRTRQTPLYAT